MKICTLLYFLFLQWRLLPRISCQLYRIVLNIASSEPSLFGCFNVRSRKWKHHLQVIQSNKMVCPTFLHRKSGNNFSAELLGTIIAKLKPDDGRLLPFWSMGTKWLDIFWHNNPLSFLLGDLVTIEISTGTDGVCTYIHRPRREL
jgi:hypothetical protein